MWNKITGSKISSQVFSGAFLLKNNRVVPKRSINHYKKSEYLSKKSAQMQYFDQRVKEQQYVEILDDSLEEILVDPIQDTWDTSGDEDIMMHVERLEEKKGFQRAGGQSGVSERLGFSLSVEAPLRDNERPPRRLPANNLKTKGQDTLLLSSEGEQKGNIIDAPSVIADNDPIRQNCLESLHDISVEVGKVMPSHHRQLTFLTQRQSMNEYACSDTRESSLAPEVGIKRVHAIALSEEQEHVIELARRKMNIFYTGSAGTGKSILLRELIKTLKTMYGNDGAVAVTASTGLAACNISGITLHSFAGIGLGIGDETTLLKKIKKSVKHKERWKNIKALVIDEVSMIDGNLLDKLDGIAKTLRRSRKPFGGIQVILCGDFFQLPPVTKADKQMKFAFQSESWKQAIDATIILKKVFRQQGDNRFIEMLNEMRTGMISDSTMSEFIKLSRPLRDDEIIPAELFSTRAEVENANYSRLATLPGQTMTYDASDGGVLENEEVRKKLLDNFLAPKKLELKIGAQVMNIKNMDSTLVNGSLGKVLAFLDSDTFTFLKGPFTSSKILNEEDVKKLSENPELEDYWSEEDEAAVATKPSKQKKREVELEKDFMKVQEQRNSVKLELNDTIFDFFMTDTSAMNDRLRANVERKKEIVRNLNESSRGARLPLVQFFTPSGESRIVLVRPETWAMEDEKDVPLVSRTQLPLILAWSLSIHKSQGQTLSKVKVDLKRVFEKGQAYVALSRAVSRDGLQVLHFDRNKVKAHDSVVKFYEGLSTASAAMNDLSADSTKTDSKFKMKKPTLSNVEQPQKRNLETMLRNRVKKNKVERKKDSTTILDLPYDAHIENILSQEN